MALLRCNEAQVALGLVSLIFLLTIPSRFSMGFRSGEFAGQSSTVTPWSLNQLLVPLAVWAKNPPIHSQQIKILHKTNKNIFLVNCLTSGKYVHLLYMYSILGRGSFCFNYCLNSAWHGGDQFVAPLRWYGSPGFFDSGLQLICIFGLLFLVFFLTITPDSLWGSGLVSLLASQAHQHHGHFTNFWCFWQCGQVPNPAGK